MDGACLSVRGFARKNLGPVRPLGRGDSLVLFTDGITEAENAREEQLGLTPVACKLETMHGSNAPRILESIETCVRDFVGETPAGDDVTMLALTRV